MTSFKSVGPTVGEMQRANDERFGDAEAPEGNFGPGHLNLAKKSIEAGKSMGQHLRGLPGSGEMSKEELQAHGKAYAALRSQKDSEKDPKYPKSLTPEQRKTAASNIRAELRGKTGQERAVKRAELMDPGPSDDSSPEERTARKEAVPGKLSQKIPAGKRSEIASEVRAERRAGGEGEYAPSATKKYYGGDADDDDYADAADPYAGAERKAIQNENAPGGSTSFNYGHNRKPGVRQQIAAKASKTTPSWPTKTPAGYERRERQAIQGEGSSRGSTKFP